MSQYTSGLVKDGVERPPWKIIQLGTHKTITELRQALLDGDTKIGPWGGDTIDRITIAPKPIKVKLFSATNAELGLPRGGYLKDTYGRIRKFGYKLCPAEAGLQLRRQWSDQPMGDCLSVAMKPITNSDGLVLLFDLSHDIDGLWLGGNDGSPDYFWLGFSRWVFCRE